MHRTVRSLASAALVLAAAAPFAAAQTTQQPTTSGSGMGSGMGHSGMSHSGGQADGLVAQLDSVNTAAKAGLTNLPVSVAGPLLESLQGKLSASSNPALKSIATDLGALRTELTASTVNGARIGAILRRVGPKVTRVAGTQRGAVRTTLREIGSELSSAGRQLSAKS